MTEETEKEDGFKVAGLTVNEIIDLKQNMEMLKALSDFDTIMEGAKYQFAQSEIKRLRAKADELEKAIYGKVQHR